MKKGILLWTLCGLACHCAAQTEVTAGVMRGKEYGVTYLLPRTEIAIRVWATRQTYTPGEFCKYADRYLHLTDVSAESSSRWSIQRVETQVVGVPDKEQVYFVKLKDKSVAPLMELTTDGIVRSINLPFSGEKPAVAEATSETSQPEIDPRQFLTEEILMASSTAKRAELVAKEIYAIRESRNALLRGEADNMPQDGAQLKLMLDHLNQQEQAMTELFAGKVRQENRCFTLHITPKEMENEVAFRFSQKLGVVPVDDLAGEPAYLTITDLKTPTLPEATPKDEKKKVDGIAYNLPGRARILLTFQGKKLYEAEMPVTQFGTVEYLAPVLFNKNSTTKVLFDTSTGGLIKVDRE